MKTRKFLSLALALIMVFAMIPVASLAENVDGLVNEAAAMRKLDNAWAALDAAEADALAQGMSRTEVINAVYTAALNLNTVDKDSFSDFTKDGFYFTVDGMYCAYNYRLRNELGKVTEPANDGIFTIKGSGRNAALKDAESPNVLLLGPYYGYDSNFDDSYKNATQPIADALEVMRHAIEVLTLEGASLEAADVNGDGVIGLPDAILIARRAMGL